MAETKEPKDPKHERLFPNAGTVKEPFRHANPDVFGRTNGNVDAVRRLAMIEARVGVLKERLHDHVERHKKMWIAGEAGRLLDKRVAATRTLTPKPDDGVKRAAVLGQAQRNVEARMAKRFTRLNQTKAKMQNTIVNTNPQQKEAQKQAKAPEQDNKQALRTTFKKARGPEQ